MTNPYSIWWNDDSLLKILINDAIITRINLPTGQKHAHIRWDDGGK